MTTVTISSKGQIVIPKRIREILGLTTGNKLKIFQENKKIILVAEPEVKPSELFVSASPHAVDKAMKNSRKIDEAKIKGLLHDLGIK
ncbi:MAG TPA: AbrB/MazE/SpoVT family DNA-binding domain-containing protein [Candidatus Methanoperedens sp.]|nr:AbrB/MazE/SpoVT family DNA-binding domain-containing protein [Candidatus Methanoperedens sp.]HLB71305.1 AbrB/MazE/SpoVT family DNA-binding domain-containing protein [Candidatus Methanoperedens sp.]